VQVGVVGKGELAKEQHVVDQTDQQAESPGADSGNQPRGERHRHHEEEASLRCLHARGLIDGAHRMFLLCELPFAAVGDSPSSRCREPVLRSAGG